VLKNLILVLILAMLWALGGLVVGVGINAFFGASWITTCALLNVMIGLLLLLLVTRNEEARRIFYNGNQNDDPGLLPIAVLWMFPMVLIFVGIIWWLLAQVIS
jgi:hypothetical protein